jgi:hypothetical protein
MPPGRISLRERYDMMHQRDDWEGKALPGTCWLPDDRDTDAKKTRRPAPNIILRRAVEVERLDPKPLGPKPPQPGTFGSDVILRSGL